MHHSRTSLHSLIVPPAPGVIAGKRILVVEDEMLISAMLEDMLMELGASVIGPAGSIADGLLLANSGRVDAAVLDVNVRNETIDPVVAALRNRRIPFILATGYGQGSAVRALGAPIIDKPYTRDRLKAALLRCLAAATPDNG